MSETTISCIIPAFNCENWLQRAVASLLATNYSRLELVIVEDGSVDATLQVATQLQAEYPGVVKVFRHPLGENRGVSASRNLGFEKSNGEWLCLLDADDYVYPNRFHSSAQILSTRPDIDGVHQLAEMVFSTTSAQEQWFENENLFGFEDPVDPSKLLERLLEGRCWATSAIVFRRSLLERTGRFKEDLRIAEDCHLWFRMAALGNLVSGDRSKPVSAYWRHASSAYQPQHENRLQFVRVLTAFFSWCKDRSVPPDMCRRVEKSVQRYIENAIVQFREQHRPDLALRVIRHCGWHFFPVFLRSAVYRHLYHLMRG